MLRDFVFCLSEKFEKLEDDMIYSTTDVNFPSGEAKTPFMDAF